MKNCPRCKSVLQKSAGQKIVCRACGFVTREVEVARDNQQFQEKIHYGKKISIIKNNDDRTLEVGNKNDNKNKEFINHYIISFQTALRHAAINLSKSHPQFKSIQSYIRHIWIAYVNIAIQNNLDIAGIFNKIVKNTKKKGKNSAKSGLKKQEQDEHDGIQEKQQQEEYNKCEQQEDNNVGQVNEVKQVTKKRIKRNRRKKQLHNEGLSTHQQHKLPFKLQIRRKLHEILNAEQQLETSQQADQFLTFLYNYGEQDFDQKTFQYACKKYCEFLAKKLRDYNLFIGVGVSQVKGRPLKLTIKQLQTMIQMRKLQFKQKNQIMAVLLLEDLLRKWADQINISTQHSLQNMLLLYKSQKNRLKKQLICTAIEYLIKGQQKQRECNDLQLKHEMSTILPVLSHNLIYSLAYLGALLDGQCLSIDDIVQHCGKISIIFQGRQLSIDQRINNGKIRKQAAKLIRILSSKINFQISMNDSSSNDKNSFKDRDEKQRQAKGFRKWVNKYANACGLYHSSNQIAKMGQTLLNAYMINKKNSTKQQCVVQKRYQFLQQDIIAKAVIIVYCKLQIGFDKYPYLSTLPQNLYDKIVALVSQQRSNQLEPGISVQHLKILQQIVMNRPKIANLSDIIFNLQKQYGTKSQRSRQLKLIYPSYNYSSLTGLNMKELMQTNKKQNENRLKFRANLVYRNRRDTIAKSISIPNLEAGQQKISLSNQFCRQIQHIRYFRDKDSKINVAQLDHPCSNYELFHDYMSNIKHVDRDLFAYFCESLAAGECPVKQLYEWVERIQRVLVDFQN